MAFNEYEAMDTFGVSSEADWQSLPRDERARKVAYCISKSLISAIVNYESSHIKSK